ncbi:hypothetical protein [Lentilactobacillus laojiaonis]|uniref:hypothetical protein n=1 Tax=Lentilactobacillus laojiaonis TaxID=2883998 RepID=UPI001D0B7439|nr:hypothetical protein [Lentilactobacillus laojiaonis]UDM32339.1 hypothetical protein LHL71_00960 [Lentilactobacillus laojiaonis]
MEDNIKLGDPVFNKMMFVLDQPVTKDNFKDYKYDQYELAEISDGIWAMPAYMVEDDEFSLFFIITQIETGEEVIAFSTGENHDGNFALSEPMTTGAGLNLANEHDEKHAQSILHFINQISKAAEGDWRMIED